MATRRRRDRGPRRQVVTSLYDWDSTGWRRFRRISSRSSLRRDYHAITPAFGPPSGSPGRRAVDPNLPPCRRPWHGSLFRDTL